MVLGPSTCSALCNTNLTATVVLKVHTTCQERFYRKIPGDKPQAEGNNPWHAYSFRGLAASFSSQTLSNETVYYAV